MYIFEFLGIWHLQIMWEISQRVYCVLEFLKILHLQVMWQKSVYSSFSEFYTLFERLHNGYKSSNMLM